MENDIEVISSRYEIHPGAHGGYTVVSVITGEALANYATLQEARIDAFRRVEMHRRAAAE